MASTDQSIKDAVINDLPHELYPGLSEKKKNNFKKL